MSKGPNTNNRKGRAVWLVMALAFVLFPAAANTQETATQPCAHGFANCFLPEKAVPPASSPDTSGADPSGYSPVLGPTKVVNMYVRASHGGPFAHHWIEVESSHGPVTIGYGPATIPFIDAGQISVWYQNGKVERMGRIPLISMNFNYAKPPGSGRPIGDPIRLTVAQSDALVEKERHRKFIFPYIPIFHDCRTFVCAMQSSVQGKSTLPCYLLFKGYW